MYYIVLYPVFYKYKKYNKNIIPVPYALYYFAYRTSGQWFPDANCWCVHKAGIILIVVFVTEIG